jgi:hypothetical protein
MTAVTATSGGARGGASGTRPPVVFLDVDGVLLPFGPGAEQDGSARGRFPDRCLAALSHVLACSGAEVVLSSTWRASDAALDEIVADFARYAAAHGGPLARIRSFAREQMTSPAHFGRRQWEIAQWLRGPGEQVGRWVALDDEPLVGDDPELSALSAQFEGHAVLCESHRGLTMELARDAVEMLARAGKPRAAARLRLGNGCE